MIQGSTIRFSAQGPARPIAGGMSHEAPSQAVAPRFSGQGTAIGKFSLMAVLAAMLGFGAHQGVDRLNGKFGSMQDSFQKTARLTDEAADAINRLDLRHVVRDVASAGVMVKGRGGLGSGWWIKDAQGNLFVVTNHHVVDGNRLYQDDRVPHTYELRMHNGSDFQDAQTVMAEIIRLDDGKLAMSEAHDMALLAVSTPNFRLPDHIRPIELRDLEKEPLRVGETVIAVGAPHGLTDNVTAGVISHIGRHIEQFEPANLFIHTTAPINPGNSGGALYDAQGRLVGINTGTIYGVDGMGLSIHTQVIREMLKHWQVR